MPLNERSCNDLLFILSESIIPLEVDQKAHDFGKSYDIDMLLILTVLEATLNPVHFV